MTAKKVVKRKTSPLVKKRKKKKNGIKDMSTADLYALYLFVSSDANKGFGVSPSTMAIVRGKQKEIEQELYMRAYGCDPFEANKVVIEGVKPEDIDLDKVATIVSGDVEEPKDEEPKRFVVAGGPLKEETGHVYNV